MRINIALFRPRTENPRAPDYAGDFPLPSECPVCHHRYDRAMRLAVWRREDKNGEHYVGGALEDAADRPQERSTRPTNSPPRHDAARGGAGYGAAPQSPPETATDRPAEEPDTKPPTAGGTELPF